MWLWTTSLGGGNRRPNRFPKRDDYFKTPLLPLLLRDFTSCNSASFLFLYYFWVSIRQLLLFFFCYIVCLFFLFQRSGGTEHTPFDRPTVAYYHTIINPRARVSFCAIYKSMHEHTYPQTCNPYPLLPIIHQVGLSIERSATPINQEDALVKSGQRNGIPMRLLQLHVRLRPRAPRDAAHTPGLCADAAASLHLRQRAQARARARRSRGGCCRGR
jgi:hypothetical protein